MEKGKELEIISTMPDAFAYHQLIQDEMGRPVDYVFLHVNEAFESMTGLRGEEILGKKVTEVLPGIDSQEFDWIGAYGEVALSSTVKRFVQYSSSLERMYQVTAYSSKPGTFITMFRDITKEGIEKLSLQKITSLAMKLLHAPLGQVEHHLLTEELRNLSGALYTVFNIYDLERKKSITKAIAGASSGIQSVMNVLGYELEGREWDLSQQRGQRIKGGQLIVFDTLYEASSAAISKPVASLLEKTLGLGRIYALEISYNNRAIGDLTFFFKKGERIKNSPSVELLSAQIGMALARARAERDLQKSEERFEDILRVLDDVVWSVSLPEYSPIYVSPGCEKVYGYSQEELMNDPNLWYKAILPEDRPLVDTTQDILYQEGYLENEYRIRRKDGELGWVRDKSWMIVDDKGNPSYMYGIVSDMTRIKEAQRNLLQSEARHRNILNLMLEGCQVLDRELRYLYVNTAAAKQSTFEADHLLGKKITEVYPDIEETEFYATLIECLETSTPKRIDNRFVFPDGRKRWFQLSVQPVPEGLFILSLDNTEQKLAEEEQRKTTEELENFFQVALDLLCIANTDGYFIKVNKAWEEILGYPTEELEKKKFLDFVHPQDMESTLEAISLLKQQKKVINFSNRYQRKDGSYRYIEWRSYPQGNIIYSAARDITSHIEAEEKLKDLNDELTHRLKERNCLHEIASLSEEQGMQLETLLERVAPIIPTGFGEPESVCSKILYRGRERKSENFRYDKRAIASPLRVKGDVVGYVYVYYLGEGEEGSFFRKEELELLDSIAERLSRIIERSLAEEALDKSREMLNQVLNSVPQSIFWKDRDLVYLGCNNMFAQDIGLKNREEIRGKTDFDLPWPKEEAKGYREDDREVIASKKAKRHIIEPLQRADGSRLFIDTTKIPLLDGEGDVFGVLGVFDDITERKKMEDDFKRSNAELEQFAYAVSHDMRQPLRMITSYMQLLEEELRESLDEETSHYMHFILDGAKRMDQMIVGLLDYSRVGRKADPKREVSSREALDEALIFLAPAIHETKAEVKIQGDWPMVFASPDELTRLFQNLIGNALKYRREGADPLIYLSVEREDDSSYRFAVKDNGIGIDPKQAHRLFKVFSRLQIRSKFEGTGIGLALCRKIVEHHGGRIWVESEGEEEGSAFYFTLPSNPAKKVK